MGIAKRNLSTTAILCRGKLSRNFDTFPLYEKRLLPREKDEMRTRKGRESQPVVWKVISRGERPIQTLNEETNLYEEIPEMIPEIIVPDLTGFELKPYVSYRVPDVEQSEFTPQDLFHAVYSQKIAKDLESGKLDGEGNPLEPSEEERLTS